MAREKEVDRNQALKMLNDTIQHMKQELEAVDNFFKKNNIKPKKIHITDDKLDWMHRAYEELCASINRYEETSDEADLNAACSRTEVIEPAFELNYGEIVGNAKAAGYHFHE